jgi:carboxymethylenebutenolidase
LGIVPSARGGENIIGQYTDSIRDDLARGLECLKSLPSVAQDRIGVVGFSLGGYFAVVLAARPDVKGIVAYYAPYIGDRMANDPTQYTFADLAAQVRAPVLMLHGDADTEAPVANARTAQSLLNRSVRQAELVVYPGVGHVFNRRPPSPGVYDASATADAQTRTLAFFKERLP